MIDPMSRMVLQASSSIRDLFMLLLSSRVILVGIRVASLARPMTMRTALLLSAWAKEHIRLSLVVIRPYLFAVTAVPPRCTVTSPPQKSHMDLGLLNLLVVPTLIRPGPILTYGLAVVLGVAKFVHSEVLYRTGACVPLWLTSVSVVTTDLVDRYPVLLICRWQVPTDLRL